MPCAALLVSFNNLVQKDKSMLIAAHVDPNAHWQLFQSSNNGLFANGDNYYIGDNIPLHSLRTNVTRDAVVYQLRYK